MDTLIQKRHFLDDENKQFSGWPNKRTNIGLWDSSILMQTSDELREAYASMDQKYSTNGLKYDDILNIAPYFLQMESSPVQVRPKTYEELNLPKGAVRLMVVPLDSNAPELSAQGMAEELCISIIALILLALFIVLLLIVATAFQHSFVNHRSTDEHQALCFTHRMHRRVAILGGAEA